METVPTSQDDQEAQPDDVLTRKILGEWWLLRSAVILNSEVERFECLLRRRLLLCARHHARSFTGAIGVHSHISPFEKEGLLQRDKFITERQVRLRELQYLPEVTQL